MSPGEQAQGKSPWSGSGGGAWGDEVVTSIHAGVPSATMSAALWLPGAPQDRSRRRLRPHHDLRVRSCHLKCVHPVGGSKLAMAMLLLPSHFCSGILRCVSSAGHHAASHSTRRYINQFSRWQPEPSSVEPLPRSVPVAQIDGDAAKGSLHLSFPLPGGPNLARGFFYLERHGHGSLANENGVSEAMQLVLSDLVCVVYDTNTESGH